MMLVDLFKRGEHASQNLKTMNAFNEFKDGIPKGTLIVKMHEGVTREEMKMIKNGLTQIMNSMYLWVMDIF